MAVSSSHIHRVRTLYKSILKVHQGLPTELRGIGDQYVKDEFKRHKEATHEQAQIFLDEWTSYYITIAKQVYQRTGEKTFGVHMKEDQLKAFSEDQTIQLYELYKETKKPVDPENPLGHNPFVHKSEDRT